MWIEFTSLYRLSGSNYQSNYLACSESDAISDFEVDCKKKGTSWGILVNVVSLKIICTYKRNIEGLKVVEYKI